MSVADPCLHRRPTSCLARGRLLFPGWRLPFVVDAGRPWQPSMLSLLLPALASTNVSLAILTLQSDARSTSAETCAGDWVNGTCWAPEPLQSVAASALTAVADFNSRDATAMPVLGSLAGCDKQLQFRLLDSGGTVAKSVQGLGDLSFGTDAVIGPVRSDVSATTAAITGALDIPQISYWSQSTDLSDSVLYPRFMRTVPSQLAPATDLCSFWKHELRLSTVAVLYQKSAYGRAYEEAAKAECQSLALTFVSKEFSEDESSREESIRDAVESLSSSGAKAVLVAAFRPVNLVLIAESALETGLLRPGTSWFFTSSSQVDVAFSELSETARAALNGSLQIKAVGSTDNNPQWAHFANERWPELQPGDFNQFLPADWQIRDDFFRTVDPNTSAVLREGGTFAYDAVIAAGLLSSRVAPTRRLPPSFGTLFWEAKQNLSFDGLSGRVEFDEKGDRSNPNVQLFNLLDQGGFSEKYVAQFNNGTWVWEGGSRESSGVIYNFGLVEPPVEAPPAPPPPSEPSLYNHEGRCGPGYPGLAGNAIGECDPNSDIDYCCSPYGWCGSTKAHCKCDGCIDYRPCYDEAVCAGGVCPTLPPGYSGPCGSGDEPPKARLPYRPLSLSAPPFTTPIFRRAGERRCDGRLRVRRRHCGSHRYSHGRARVHGRTGPVIAATAPDDRYCARTASRGRRLHPVHYAGFRGQ